MPSLCRFGICRMQRKANMRKVFLLIFIFSLASFIYFSWKSPSIPKFRRHLQTQSFCPASNRSRISRVDDLKVWGPKNRNSAHILIIAKSSSSFREAKDLLMSVRLKYKVQLAHTGLPDMIKLSKGGVGKYFVIVFEDIRDYYYMDNWNREILDKYCRQWRAGIIGFVPSLDEPVVDQPLQDPLLTSNPLFNSTSTLSLSSHLELDSAKVLNHSLLKILKSDIEVEPEEYDTDWVGFTSLNESMEPVVTGTLINSAGEETEHPIVVHEPGTKQRIRKVLISGSSALQFWLTRLVFLDAVQFLANKQLIIPLTRYILIDIDDIFVGTARLTRGDVLALVNSQEKLAESIHGFRYNLGFSGSYFLSGTYEEDEGDEELITQRSKFTWFPHMWRHIQPHKFNNISDLIYRMELNKKFASDKGLPVDGEYSVAPHHSGVFPVHQQLYDAWKKVWNIGVTSTEEYPNLRPARRRKGFIHSGIAVLPRQTCGLYTKNLYYDEYPGGPEKLETSIAGGELFNTVVTNPISIFMTHMPNYCCDQLAPYAFESVVNFISCFTNLDLRTVSPRQLADKYFSLFPEEKSAVWSDPCMDRRHLEIFSPNKSCNRLPNLLVIGPQKTGTTALHTFLKLHPNVVSNLPTPESFEEIQFFNEKNYHKGLDWFQQYFPEGNSSTFLFEKSATYFDGEYIPMRAYRLVPRAKIVTIFIRPEDRAYSWYHHIRAHSDPTALSYSFKEVVHAGPESPKALLSLQSRCLEPGKYAQHLEKWLSFYRPKQVHIIDGEKLKKSPVSVMNELQHFLGLPFVSYADKLIFDKKKGFYCAKKDDKKKCLGKGKGRQYPPMDRDTQAWLKKYYKHHDDQLRTLLTRLGYPLPAWLAQESL